jgi:ketosteroid isomerase-like protein
MAHPNEDLIRRGFEAFSTGDMDTLRNEIFAPDVIYHVPGRSQLSGDYTGIDEVLGFFGKLFELTGGTFRVELHDVLANNEHGIALSPATGEREGKSLQDNGVLVFHFKDGRTSEVWLHPTDQHATDEFFS